MATLEQLDEQLAAVATDARAQLGELDATQQRIARVLHRVEHAGGAGRGRRVESIHHGLRALRDARRAVEEAAKRAEEARQRLPKGGWGSVVTYGRAMWDAGQTDVGEALRQISAAELIRHLAEAAALSALEEVFDVHGAWKLAANAAGDAAVDGGGDLRNPARTPAEGTPRVIHDASEFLRGKVTSSNGRIVHAAWTTVNNKLVEITDPATVPTRVVFGVTRGAVLAALALTPAGWFAVPVAGVALKVGRWALVKGTTRVLERQ